MARKLRDVTRDFARGEVPLETLRSAARAERLDRYLADRLLQLISEWENSDWANSAWSRDELRDRADRLVPAAAPPTPASGKDNAASMYAAGLRGQRRPS